MRGRDYKRQQDEGVILVLLAATQGLSLEGPDTAAGEEGRHSKQQGGDAYI